MKPRKPESSRHDDFFRTKLEQLINQRHELCRLAQVIDWPSCEQRFGASQFVDEAGERYGQDFRGRTFKDDVRDYILPLMSNQSASLADALNLSGQLVCKAWANTGSW